jgi:hypothetical protein
VTGLSADSGSPTPPPPEEEDDYKYGMSSTTGGGGNLIGKSVDEEFNLLLRPGRGDGGGGGGGGMGNPPGLRNYYEPQIQHIQPSPRPSSSSDTGTLLLFLTFFFRDFERVSRF